MERYCISLEQAKKLWELGYSAGFGAQWYWIIIDGSPVLTDYGPIVNDTDGRYPAWHVGELGEILPAYLDKGCDTFYLELAKYDTGFAYAYLDKCEISAGYLVQEQFGATEAQARGALLINLVEEGLIDVPFRKSTTN